MNEQVALASAAGKIGSALFAFEESLGVLPVLTANQRRQIAVAAAELVRECIDITNNMNLALIRRALDE